MTHPIPARLAHRPTQGGLAVPYISVIAGGRAYLGGNHTSKLIECITRGLCQACGQRLSRPMVILVPDTKLPERYSDEPPLHPECAAYSMAACPMLNGRLDHYREQSNVDGLPCDKPGCDCAGWVPTDKPRTTLEAGTWSAVWVNDYAIAVDDKGQPHGVMWTSEPLKIRPVRKPEPAPTVCALCHQEAPVPGTDLCPGCTQAHDYWTSLTPEERRAEDAAIAAYVDQTREDI